MKFKLFVLAVAGIAVCSAELPRNAVRDVLSTPALKDTRVQGKIGAKLDRFMYERCRSDFARSVIVREAREAFAHPDDDVFNAPLGMWKGEFWGKLMISSARVAQYTDDPEFTEFLRQEAHRLMKYQKPDGYLGTYVDPTFVVPHDPAYAQKVQGWPSDWCWNLWCRKYTMWGLLMIYQTTGDREILAAAEKAMAQQITMLRKLGIKLCDTGTSAMAGMPSCSVLKPLVMLYRETGNPLFLDYAKEIVSYWDRPGNPKPNFFPNAASGKSLAEWYDTADLGRWGKAYEMMSCLDGVLEYYRLTGEARCLEMVRQMQTILWTFERNPVENVGYNDQFVGAARHLNGTSEPCDAIHWIRLNLDLYLITGDKKYVDVIESTYLNAFLAGIFRDGKWGAREVRSHGRHVARFGQSGMRWQHCCVNNMPRTFMDIASLGATREGDGTLRVNLYSPFTADFGEASVMVTGDFPIDDKATVRIETKQPGRVKFRLPGWSKTVAVRQLPDSSFKSLPAGDWYEMNVPAGISAVTLKFDMTARLVESDLAADNDRTDYRFRRWNTGPHSVELYRTTPAARLFRGPLLLAKSEIVGDTAEDILRADLNKGGWSVKLRAFGSDRVMGAWEATFTRGGETYRTKVCDFPSAGDWLLEDDATAFSIFF